MFRYNIHQVSDCTCKASDVIKNDVIVWEQHVWSGEAGEAVRHLSSWDAW